MESLNTPKLLVVGGTGFIGHHLLKVVKKKGWILTSISLKKPSKKRLVDGVKYLFLDLSNINLTRKHICEEFDYVVNLGGYINHQLFQDGGNQVIHNHFTALQNLIEILPRSNLKRFVNIGSSDEYGNVTAPQNEECREKPISPYSLAKVANTHFLQMLYRTENFPAVTLRLFLTYGEGQDTERFLPQIILSCLNNSKFSTSFGKQIRDFCYIEDTIVAIIQALITPKTEGEVINIASGIPISIRTIIERVREMVGLGEPKYGEIPYRKGENMELYANVEKAKNILKWETTIDLEKGLQRTIDWFTNEYSQTSISKHYNELL